jgi:transcriptional regulator with XRE-family HTH domain
MANDNDKKLIERTAARLRKARQESGLTQVEVAKKAEISENHYAQIERAEKNPTASTLLNIIRAIGVSAAQILD